MATQPMLNHFLELTDRPQSHHIIIVFSLQNKRIPLNRPLHVREERNSPTSNPDRANDFRKSTPRPTSDPHLQAIHSIIYLCSVCPLSALIQRTWTTCMSLNLSKRTRTHRAHRDNTRTFSSNLYWRVLRLPHTCRKLCIVGCLWFDNRSSTAPFPSMW